MKVEFTARAKVNLTLDVLGKRPDGYHELRMITAPIDLCDEGEIEFTGRDIVCVCGEFSGESNLAARAARLFSERLGERFGAVIRIEKRIPAMAGLGGGSADAAAALNALNGRFGNPFTLERLRGIAAEIGSDVPFCLEDRVQLTEGRGEILTPLPDLPPCEIRVIKPPENLSTAEVFAAYRPRPGTPRPDTEGFIAALREGDLRGMAERVYNVLEETAVKLAPGILRARETLLAQGASGVSVTGSGSAVFGVFGV